MYACIDVGGTSIKVAVADKDGNLFRKGRVEVADTFEELANNIFNWIDEVKKEYIIEGIAISSPGAVNVKTGIVGGSSALPCIHGPNWKKVFKNRFNLPVSIENDANCAALAEVFSGTAKNVDDMLFVVCGTGIGGAIVKDGKIHHGKHLYGGEFGYIIVEEVDGLPKNWSETSSTMSFVRKVRAHYNDDSFDGEKVFKAAENGDEYCKEVIDIFYKNLAKGIFNLQHIYDPEMILLGGAISSRKDFIDNINKKIKELREKITIETIEPKLAICTHNKDANLIGALANFLSEYNIKEN